MISHEYGVVIKIYKLHSIDENHLEKVLPIFKLKVHILLLLLFLSDFFSLDILPKKLLIPKKQNVFLLIYL